MREHYGATNKVTNQKMNRKTARRSIYSTYLSVSRLQNGSVYALVFLALGTPFRSDKGGKVNHWNLEDQSSATTCPLALTVWPLFARSHALLPICVLIMAKHYLTCWKPLFVNQAIRGTMLELLTLLGPKVWPRSVIRGSRAGTWQFKLSGR